jgi:hypothetical protein
MDHSEAVKQMAVERYLLDELTPALRDEFEEHAFDCRECALDLRAGAAFTREAKAQLPGLVASKPAPAASRTDPRKSRWSFWWQPAFAMPAFAVLLLFIGYQNLATIPALRSAANQPRLLPWISLHAGTRGAAHTPLAASRAQGAVLLIEVPENSAYTSYAFDLYDPDGKRFWSQTAAAGQAADSGGAFSLVIPGAGLQQGAYTLSISGVTAQGQSIAIDRRVLDIHFED